MDKHYRISNNSIHIFSFFQSDSWLKIYTEKKRIIMTLTNVQTFVLGVKITQSDWSTTDTWHLYSWFIWAHLVYSFYHCRYLNWLVSIVQIFWYSEHIRWHTYSNCPCFWFFAYFGNNLSIGIFVFFQITCQKSFIFPNWLIVL